ncbi:hypothetical protein [Pseudomonas costantinii]|uniref:Uncharacterized protein n=1 Tax=Pseudomonas costantinii TaxID=168469 RepID=A0A1S2UBU5_9PSED|nr:hypothetical protein [Pseudomonas costantinii]NVZ20563.1 hypothetical protein [Pseudomonas costantinii]OIN43388.1 hypothetical protein BFL40_32605 [Pseudomonas costantinii]SEE36927.1 hypothetical protein SAMN04515675_5171 [Pseudomonas costantinii]
MMLLRTLVLERNGQDAPVNGALLCGFAIAQTDSNFLVYSLDEETEPGNSRVYIAALRKKLERYFLGGVESKEDLQVAMQAFKQILMVAASGTKTGTVIENPVAYHFIDLKGCKLPPARPEDHHSMIIKKALVMKVITLGMSAPVLPAIESAALIVPSIRFSSQMSSSPRVANPSEPSQQSSHEHIVGEQLSSSGAISEVVELAESSAGPAQLAPSEPAPSKLPAQMGHASLLEVDSTLTSLAKVAQELAQQKLVIIEREEMLELWQVRLQQAQSELDEKGRELEQRGTQLQNQALEVGQKAEKLTLAMSHLSGMRQRLQGVLLELDQALDGQG